MGTLIACKNPTPMRSIHRSSGNLVMPSGTMMKPESQSGLCSRMLSLLAGYAVAQESVFDWCVVLIPVCECAPCRELAASLAQALATPCDPGTTDA